MYINDKGERVVKCCTNCLHFNKNDKQYPCDVCSSGARKDRLKWEYRGFKVL